MNKQNKQLFKFMKVFSLNVKQQIMSILCSTCLFYTYHAILENDKKV